jgi:PTS system nitrogen regulatory IIA component
MDFGALDGLPVGVLFTIVSPTVRDHLHLLSELAFALKDPGFKSVIARAGAPGEILAEVLRLEETIHKSTGISDA